MELTPRQKDLLRCALGELKDSYESEIADAGIDVEAEHTFTLAEIAYLDTLLA